MRLLEYGLVNEACKYVEVLAKAVNSNPKLHADKISTIYQLANRLRVYDPDFNAEDLSNPDSEPQWFHELSNNYKKQHLNKLWHLLPSNESSKKSEPLPVQQAQAQQQAPPSNQNNLNVNTKMEPKSANPSPNQQKPMVNEFQYGQQTQQQQQQAYEPIASSQQYDPQYEAQQQLQQQQQQMAGLNYQMGQMNFEDVQPRATEEAPPQVQTQQSMPFNIAVVADPNALQPNQQYYQPTPESNYKAAPQPQQDYQQPPPVPQFYNPATMQTQAQPAGNYVDPRNLESSRKSSVSSSAHPQTPSYNTNNQQAMFNFAQPAPPTNPPGPQMFYNPNDSMQSNQRYSDKSASRSRQISTSSNSNDNNVLSFSGSQQTLSHSQPMMFDPNASVSKSQSFPSNNVSQDDRYGSDRNDKDSDSRSNGKVKQEEEDDDSAKSSKNAQDKQAPKAAEVGSLFFNNPAHKSVLKTPFLIDRVCCGELWARSCQLARRPSPRRWSSQTTKRKR